MYKIKRIIKEEYFNFINEYYGEEGSVAERYYNQSDELKNNIFQDFLYHNNSDFTKHIPWKVIPYPRLKKIWEDYMVKGIVRDEKGMGMIKGIMIRNTLKIEILTTLVGHTVSDPSEDYDNWFGEYIKDQLNCIFEKYPDLDQLEIPFDDPKAGHIKKIENSPCNIQINPHIKSYVEENFSDDSTRIDIEGGLMEMLQEKFSYDYMDDPKGELGGFISDYGLKPLVSLVGELMATDVAEKELVIIDRMLNVIHQRSDIASWFVQGGSNALADLSGYDDPQGDSAISGKYRMHDY